MSNLITSQDLVNLFFNDLRHYNSSNFRTIAHADLSKPDAIVYKSCSSVVTRFFIFQEKHPEIPEENMKILYFKLRIDMIARYFSEYPAANYEDLKPFQRELQSYLDNNSNNNSAQSISEAV